MSTALHPPTQSRRKRAALYKAARQQAAEAETSLLSRVRRKGSERRGTQSRVPAKFQECGLYFASSLCSLKLPKRRLFRFFHASAEICLFSLPKTQLFSSPHVCCGFFSGAGYISRVHLGAKFPKRRLFRFFQERGYISRVHLGLNFRKDVCSVFFTRVWKDGCSYCRKHLFSSSRREGPDYHRRKHLPKTQLFRSPAGESGSLQKSTV